MKKSQVDQIAEILVRDGKIDNFFAINTRLTLRLGMHIHLLRQKGWVIDTDMQGKNCVYRLVAQPKAEQLLMNV